MADEVKLLSFWASPFGIRVQLALEEKGVSYEYQEENLANKSELLLKSNPIHKKVPVLLHKGRPVVESNIIVQYIDETWPGKGSLMPCKPFDRAQARFWADFIDKKYFECGAFQIVKSEGDALEDGKKNLLEYLSILNSALGDKPYFGGDDCGFLDIVYLPFMSWFKGLESIGNFNIPLEKDYPQLNQWMQKCMQKESVKKLLPNPERMKDLLHLLRNYFQSLGIPK